MASAKRPHETATTSTDLCAPVDVADRTEGGPEVAQQQRDKVDAHVRQKEPLERPRPILALRLAGVEDERLRGDREGELTTRIEARKTEPEQETHKQVHQQARDDPKREHPHTTENLWSEREEGVSSTREPGNGASMGGGERTACSIASALVRWIALMWISPWTSSTSPMDVCDGLGMTSGGKETVARAAEKAIEIVDGRRQLGREGERRAGEEKRRERGRCGC